MVIDQGTRKAIPNASGMFLQPGYPASGCFNGTNISPDLIRKSTVHINDPKLVGMTQDKAELFKKLDRMGYPMPNYIPMDNMVKKGVFDLGQYNEKFGDSSVHLLRDGNEVEVNDLGEMLHAMNSFLDQDAVAYSSKLENPTRAYAQVIPNANGKTLNRGQQVVKNGVLSHNIPGGEFLLDLLNMMKDVVDDIGLDYARVQIEFDSAGNLNIIDVDTKLRQADIPPMRQYMDMLARAQAPAKKKLLVKH